MSWRGEMRGPLRWDVTLGAHWRPTCHPVRESSKVQPTSVSKQTQIIRNPSTPLSDEDSGARDADKIYTLECDRKLIKTANDYYLKKPEVR